jgi:acyl-coenzyme A thioesterase PaaI-like protein
MMVRDDGGQPLSIQQQYYPQITCFGCGPGNSQGLQLRSYLKLGEVVATFMPWPEHDNGVGYLNGGIISTLLDCHSAAAVMTEAGRRGWATLPGTALPFLTAGLDVRFLRPAPLHAPVDLRAAVVSATEPEITVEVQLIADDKTRATGLASWRRWRPRN